MKDNKQIKMTPIFSENIFLTSLLISDEKKIRQVYVIWGFRRKSHGGVFSKMRRATGFLEPWQKITILNKFAYIDKIRNIKTTRNN